MENMVMNLFGHVYKGKRVFITGNTGFKGSWLSLWLNAMGAEVFGYSLPEKTSPSHHELLALKSKTYYGDIRDASFLQQCIEEVQPDIVFHMAAQALVRESYKNPVTTYQTNVIGTLNVFEAVRYLRRDVVVVNVTTDKVYDNKEWNWPYREIDNLGGYDMYSSSKACSEILSASYANSFFNSSDYGKTHKVLLASARAGNVIGGGDWAADRLIPDVIRSIAAGEKVTIRSARSIRPWEHVLEPLSGYLLLGQKLLGSGKEFAGAWNFGPDAASAISVHDVLLKLKDHWPKVDWTLQDNSQENFHEARILKLDCSKAITELGWRPVWSLDETLEHTAGWYRNFYEKGTLNSMDDLTEYVRRASQQKRNWTVL